MIVLIPPALYHQIIFIIMRPYNQFQLKSNLGELPFHQKDKKRIIMMMFVEPPVFHQLNFIIMGLKLAEELQKIIFVEQ